MSKSENFQSLLKEVGLHKYYPKKLCIRDAIQIRDITLNPANESILYPFIILQKIMAFDSKCRIPFNKSGTQGAKSENSSDTESDESENDDSVHPVDSLLALIHCCSDFLRQDIFCRMATCQIALPLLLPHPHTGELTLLLWAMRGIIKEFVLPEGKNCCGRIIDFPMPFVSFLRVGSHDISKSEIINDVMSKTDSDNRNKPFLGYSFPGSDSKKILVHGTVEISWYLPGDELYPLPVAFINLRGDACYSELDKQVNFLCKISAANVLLLSSDAFTEDATKEGAVALMNKFSSAPGMSLILPTKKESKKLKEKISEAVGESSFQTKFKVIKYEKNRTVFNEKLKEVLVNIISSTSKVVSLSDVALESKFALDEHDSKCARGRELMQKLYSVVNDHLHSNAPEHSSKGHLLDKSPKDLLCLQSAKLWHKWASLDKEQYRQKHKHKHGKLMADHGDEEMLSKEYGEEQRKQMKKVREDQYAIVKRDYKGAKVMPLFINAISVRDKMVLWYFMQWLKFALDDLSRELLPPFYAKLRELRTRLNDTQRNGNVEGEKECLQKLQDLDKRMINASFGLEHLMREVGQMYEAVAEQEDVTHPQCIVKDLPHIAAQMLCDGFTLELLDGDAAHMPGKWIQEVLRNLAKLLKGKSERDPGIYVLSVLGIQSTGKSTLLNTVFGVQFSVSAGRCTQGAFMQLLPVHPSLCKKIGVEYFLLIDTEGLRAPELDRLAGFEHDNELATFVIGVANQTLINVAGEVAGEIDDVLNAAVHAFMRMSEVNLKPSCRIVHQNVPAVAAENKLLQGRLKTKDKLDKMTKAAAKDTDKEAKYKFFSDVIEFDHKEDVSEFVGLWNGELPMAQVSSGYSKRAQQLKVDIIKKCEKTQQYRNSVPLLLTHLGKLWNAILQEDFVFTFQNTYEIVAFKTLELKYSDCSCEFTTDMNVLQQAAESELYGCMVTELEAMLKKHMKLLQDGALDAFKKYEKQMIDFFRVDDMMLKWKQDIEIRLKQLYEELERNAKENCMQVYQARRDRNEAESEREALSIMIQGKVVGLTKEIGEKKISESKPSEIFDQTWSEWIKNIKVAPFRMPDIPHVVEKCLTDRFPGQWKEIRTKVSETGLEKSAEFKIGERHIKGKSSTFQSMLALVWKNPHTNNILQKAQTHTNETFTEVENYLKRIKTSDGNFSSQSVTDMLQIVHKRRTIETKEFVFTTAYEVEIAIAACSKAVPLFKKMAEKFRKKHDPKVYIESEMKPNFKCMFIDMVNKVEYEKIAAERLCSQLKEPIRKCILQNLPSLIFKEMTSNYPWTKHKQTFVAKILLEIGERLNRGNGFELCTDFLTNARSSLETWAKYFIEEHCHSRSPHQSSSHLFVMAERELNITIDFLIEKTESTSRTLSRSKKVNIREWFKHFHSQVMGKIKVSLVDLNMYVRDDELSVLKFFTDQVKEGLESFRSTLFQNITYSETIGRESAHDMVVKKVAGCTEQCPFCGAQCELTISSHTSGMNKSLHSTQHRPQALGRYHWVKDNTAILDTCTYLVSTNCNFRNAATEEKYHPYKDYRDIYSDWFIQADKSFESSLYWKWFIGHYSTRIEEFFHFAKTDIPGEWKCLQWRKVREWLITEYKLQ